MKRIATIANLFLLLCFLPISGKTTPANVSWEIYSHTKYENARYSDRAYLGVHLAEISEKKATLLGADNVYGSYVTRVIPGSAAEKAGLKPLDYVVGIDQHKADEDTDLHEILEIYEAGSEATLHLFRQGKPMDVKVTFGPKSNESESNKTRSFLGISPADEDDRDDDATVGVAVDVTKESAAAAMGLQDGDVITAINGYTMIDWTDISAIIRSLEPESDVTLSIRRNDETLTKTGKMGKKDSEDFTGWNNAAGRSGAGFSWSGSGNWKQSEDQSGDAFLGVNLGTMTKEKAKKLGFSNAYGTYVSSVIPGTGAAKAGLQAFDYIYGVDEYRVGEGQSLSFILRKFSAGQKANIYFIRKGQERNVSVTLSSKNEDYDEDNDWEDDCDRPFLGVSQSHETYAEKGIQVNIVEGSTAKEMGMKSGDLLTSINGYPIIDWGDITMALGTIKAGSAVNVDYLREGKKVTASKTIKSVCDARKSTSYNFNFNKSEDKDKEEGWVFKSAPQIVRVNPANVKAKMEDMGKEDVDKLKAQGVTMPAINNLRLEKINLFPNPTKGLFRLQFELPEKGQTEVKVLNAAGRTIYEYELGNFSGEFSDEVDISQNGVGTYFLQIRQGDKYASKKIVLQ